ncbi:hypothetical protein ACX80V_03385 [Arthrobacter sp. MDT3-24]
MAELVLDEPVLKDYARLPHLAYLDVPDPRAAVPKKHRRRLWRADPRDRPAVVAPLPARGVVRSSGGQSRLPECAEHSSG